MKLFGVDVGSRSSILAGVRQTGIDILLKENSETEIPSIVPLGPNHIISQLKHLVGRGFFESSEELGNLPFVTSEAPDGSIQFHERDRVFTATEVLALLFQQLRSIAEANLRDSVADCVVSIPCYFTDRQRSEYLVAAKIAGLNPLRLMHDCTAAALNYAISRGLARSTSNVPTNVLFVDIGHRATQAAVVSFQPGKMTVLAHSFDESLGGRDFDDVLFRYFAEQFRVTHDFDVNSNSWAARCLRATCEKMKQMLTDDSETFHSIARLIGEKDAMAMMKRDQFEQLSGGLLERILFTCQSALSHSGLAIDALHTLEMVGAGSRVPAIKRILGNHFRREPNIILKAGDCVARGCAIQCAMLSPRFITRLYKVQEIFPFSVGSIIYNGLNLSSVRTILFMKGEPIPSERLIILHEADHASLKLVYDDLSKLPTGAPSIIKSYKCKVPQSANPEVKHRILLDLHGIVSVESAHLQLVENVRIHQYSGKMNSSISLNLDPESSVLQADTRSIHQHSRGMNHSILNNTNPEFALGLQDDKSATCMKSTSKSPNATENPSSRKMNPEVSLNMNHMHASSCSQADTRGIHQHSKEMNRSTTFNMNTAYPQTDRRTRNVKSKSECLPPSHAAVLFNVEKGVLCENMKRCFWKFIDKAAAADKTYDIMNSANYLLLGADSVTIAVTGGRFNRALLATIFTLATVSICLLFYAHTLKDKPKRQKKFFLCSFMFTILAFVIFMIFFIFLGGIDKGLILLQTRKDEMVHCSKTYIKPIQFRVHHR